MKFVPLMNLFEKGKERGLSKRKLHTNVVLATHISMLKSDNKKVWKLQDFIVGFKLPFLEL